MACETYESTALRVSQAFNQHRYPWAETDPYLDQYRRWVLDTPDLQPVVNALLKARERALQKKEYEDAEDLRRE